MQTSCTSIETSSGGPALKRKRNGGGDTFEWDELEDDFIVDLGEEEDFGSEIKDYGWEEKGSDASWVGSEYFNVCYADEEVDLDSKGAALRVSQIVVLLLSGTGEKKLFSCSGTIIECEYEPETGEFIAAVLTSASILRFPSVSGDASPIPGVTVHVYLAKGEPLEGEVHHCDLHYNIAIIKFRSKQPLPKAILRSIFNPVHYAADEPKRDSNLFSLCYGDKVIAMARIGEDRSLTFKPGVFRNVPQFSLGMNLANLCEADVHDLDYIIRKFPCFDIYSGLIVKKVKRGFPADHARIDDKDIIIECNGEIVKVSIEFWKMIWDRASQDVMLYVLRARDLTFSRIIVATDEPIYSRWVPRNWAGRQRSHFVQWVMTKSEVVIRDKQCLHTTLNLTKDCNGILERISMITSSGKQELLLLAISVLWMMMLAADRWLWW